MKKKPLAQFFSHTARRSVVAVSCGAVLLAVILMVRGRHMTDVPDGAADVGSVLPPSVPADEGDAHQDAAAISPQDVPGAVSPKTPLPFAQAMRGREYGMWVWDSPIDMSEEYMRKVVDTASANAMTVLYVTFNDVPEAPKEEYTAAVVRLIAIAHAKNIAIDAETGERDWGDPAQHERAYAVLDYVLAYNAAHPAARIRGLQYDIEPYLIPGYDDDKPAILQQYLSLIDMTVERIKVTDLAFSVVIPHFYDSVVAWTPVISYGGQEGYVFDHLLRITDRMPASTLIVMAYRNTAEGDNGAIAVSSTEVRQASRGAHATKIIIAQETGDVDPAYTTFHGMSKADYLAQAAIIADAFAPYGGFGGIAVDYITPFLQLK